MSPNIPAPQYTLNEAIGVCLRMGQLALAEVRALARMPGPRGERGEQGKQGPPGDRGVKGETGRNASDLTLLQEHIDQRFERMFKAASVTTVDGGRTLRWAIGDTVHEIKTAVVLDAGVWREGTAYVAGDGVTLGGSFFIAQADTTAKPGKSDEWRLAVKRGSDGRDARTERALEPVRFK
jgi:hypothetical protein